MSDSAPTYIRWTTVPGNLGYVIPFDSTYNLTDVLNRGALAAGSAYLAPGPKRGQFPNWTLKGVCRSVGGSDIAVAMQSRTLNAGTSGDWETDSGGTMTITAGGAGAPFHWHAAGIDFRLLLTAGATGPTSLLVEITLIPSGFDVHW